MLTSTDAEKRGQRLRAADGHRLLYELATRAEQWMRRGGAGFLGYSAATVAKRHTQKLLAETAVPFRRELKRRAARGADFRAILQDEQLVLGDVVVRPRSGAIAVRPRGVARWCGLFFARWLYVLFQASLAVRLRVRLRESATLFYGVAEGELTRGGSDASLADFIHNGPVAPLRDAAVMYVQALNAPPASDPARVRYAREPLIALMRERGLAPSEYARLVVLHVRSAGAFLRAFMRSPAICMLERDFAFEAVAACLNESRALGAIVITGSNHLEQMLWVTDLPGRVYRSHMLFYSVNVMTFVYKEHPVVEHLTTVRYMRLDEYWVWTPGEAAIVREWVPGAVCNVVGPILMYLPRPAVHAHPERLRIAVFDIAPLDAGVVESSGVIEPYYTLATTLAFVRGVVAARDALARELGRDIEIVLKPKRKYDSIRSTAYIDFLRECEARVREFKIADARTDLVELISSSHIVVTLPYSSPPYIAARLGVPSVYYDASGELLPRYEHDPLVTFVGSAAALEQAIRATLQKVLSGSESRAAAR